MNNEENFQGGAEVEIEARIVAWVLGEASPFEAAELARRVAAQPELAVFKRRIEAVHGLVGEASRPVREPLMLAPERRAKLLAVFGAPEKSEGDSEKKTPILAVPLVAQRKRWPLRTWMLPVAACLTVGVFLGALFLPVVVSFEKKPVRPDPDQTLLGPSFDASGSLKSQMTAGENEKAASNETLQLSAFEVQSKPSLMRRAQNVVRSLADSANEGDALAKKKRDDSRMKEEATMSQRSPQATIRATASAPRPEEIAQVEAKVQEYGRARQNERAGKMIIDEIRTVSGDKGRGASAPATVGGSVTLWKNRQGVVAADAFGEQPAAPSRVTFGAGSRLTLGVDQKRVDNVASGKAGNAPLSEPTPAPTRDLEMTLVAQAKSEAFVAGIIPVEAAKSAALDARKDADADRPVVRTPPAFDETLRTEVLSLTQAVSTFSLHVSDVSFRLARAALARGERPDSATIRPEEFYNAFDYGDPAPAANEPVSCRVEQAAHPFLQQRNLIRIAMKVPATGRGAGQPLRLTVLLDTSGSMEREDRAASVRRALEVLASLLGPNDRVTLIGFARQPRLLVDRLSGDQAAKLVDIVGRTPAEGGTNLEEALKLASEHARTQFTEGAQNRIVVLTDGAANLGNDNPAQLAALIAALRQQHIAFDACGVGLDGLDDSILEALTRQGDGRYYVINSPADADGGFARQLAGAFRPAAENVKVQVRFNPARVRAYRLIGFEQHRLREEDFRNDQVDAAELAAEEAAVALYQVEVLPEGEGELGEVFVRFRRGGSEEMVERSWTLSYAPQVARFDRATPSLQLAGTAAFLAEKLRGGGLASQIRLDEFAPVVNTLRSHYARDARVQELVTMFAQTRRLFNE